MPLKNILSKVEWELIENISENDLIDPRLDEYFLELFYKKRIFCQLNPEFRTQQLVVYLFEIFRSIDASTAWLDSIDIIQALCHFCNEGYISIENESIQWGDAIDHYLKMKGID